VTLDNSQWLHGQTGNGTGGVLRQDRRLIRWAAGGAAAAARLAEAWPTFASGGQWSGRETGDGTGGVPWPGHNSDRLLPALRHRRYEDCAN